MKVQIDYVNAEELESQDVNESNRFDEVSGSGGMYFDSGFALADYFFAR